MALRATATSLGRDLYWKLATEHDGVIRWIGYNDSDWWLNVAMKDQARCRTGKTTGRVYRIDFQTGGVEMTESAV